MSLLLAACGLDSQSAANRIDWVYFAAWALNSRNEFKEILNFRMVLMLVDKLIRRSISIFPSFYGQLVNINHRHEAIILASAPLQQLKTDVQRVPGMCLRLEEKTNSQLNLLASLQQDNLVLYLIFCMLVKTQNNLYSLSQRTQAVGKWNIHYASQYCAKTNQAPIINLRYSLAMNADQQYSRLPKI